MPVPDNLKFSWIYPGSFLQVDTEGRLVIAPISVAVSGGAVTVSSGSISNLRSTTVITLTIANNASLSDAMDMRGYASGIIDIPSSLIGHMHFKVSNDNSTFTYLYDEFINLMNVSPSAVAGAAQVTIPSKIFASHYVKIQMDTTATGTSPQTQSGAKTLKVMLKS